MLERKVIETSVDLFDAADIYSADIVSTLITKLSARYINTCYASMFITKIAEIVRYSDTYLVDNRLDGGASINVQFIAEGVILVKGEVLHGCKVIRISNTGIIIEHKYAIGIMIADEKKKAITLVKVDQLVPVIINDVHYNIGKSQISISCYPYTPMVTIDPYYQIEKGLSDGEITKVSNLLQTLNEENDKHAIISKSNSYGFFKDIMYPYQTQQKFALSKIGSNFKSIGLNIKDISAIDVNYITMQDVAIESCLLGSKVKPIGTIIVSSLYPAISEVIQKRIMYLTALRGFAEQYDTIEKVQELMAYWKICKSLKV